MNVRPLSVLLILVACLVRPAFAADEIEKTVPRVYDVADFVMSFDPRPPTPPPTLGSLCFPSTQDSIPTPPGQGSAEAADWLGSLVREQVAPGSWKEDGGQTGMLRFSPDNLSLFITQTDAAHAEIAKVLDALRQTRADTPVLKTQVDWRTLDVDDPALTGKTPPDDVFTRAVPYAVAVTTGLPGRPIDLAGKLEQTVLATLTPVVAQQSVGYELSPKSVASGTTLKILPRLLPGGKTAFVELASRVTEATPGAPTTRPTDSALVNGPSVDALDRPATLTEDLRATVRVPLGQRVMAGSFTLPPRPTDRVARQMVVWVRVDVMP